MWNRALNRDEDRTDVDRDQPVEFRRAERSRCHRMDGDSRVVDEDVQPAELGHGLVDRLRDLLGVGAVGLDGDCRAAGGGHLGDQLLGLGAPSCRR